MKRTLLKTLVLAFSLTFVLMLLTSCQIFFKPIYDSKTCEHEYVITSTPPDCVSDGITNSVCRFCGDIKSSKGAPKLGHTFGQWHVTVDPTETAIGKEERICSVCGFKESATVMAHAHVLVKKEAVAVTCDTDGWNEYSQCKLCSYNDKIIIEATGHEWGEYVSKGDSTHTRVCANDPSHFEISPCQTDGSDGVCKICGGTYEFAVRPGNSIYGYNELLKFSDGEKMQRLYRDLNYAAELFFASDEDVIAREGYYIIGNYKLSDYGLSLDAAKTVWKTFYVSSPAYYWLDGAVVTSYDTVHLTIADDYASANYRKLCNDKIAEMERECKEALTGKNTELERAMAITEYIVKNLEYAYEEDGKTPVDDMWAHNMSGFATYGLGVCESYSKSFLYLCLLNGVECLVGSGTAEGENHSWNYVKLNDAWYGADLTWTDIYGNDEVVYDFFGLSRDALFDSHHPHPSDVMDVAYIYEAPKLSETNFELTKLTKNGEYVGMYGSIGEAFGDMTDKGASYEIYIGYYSSQGSPISHTIGKTETPEGVAVTIRGKNEYFGKDYIDGNSVIILDGVLTLKTSLTLIDVHVELGEKANIWTDIELNGCTLTLKGKSVYLGACVSGIYSDSTLVASTERGAFLYGGAMIYRLTVRNGKVVFGANSTVTHCSGNNLYTANGADVSIKYYD